MWSTPGAPGTSLLPAYLDDAEWAALPGVVEAIHRPGAVRGTVAVRHGSNAIARFVARCLRFPPPSEGVAVELQVTALEPERALGPMSWARTFGTRRMAPSIQEITLRGLRESYGPFACEMMVYAMEGGVRYEPVGGSVRMGRWWMPLPTRIAPRASAEVRARGDAAWISVTLALPGIGAVLGYEGEVAPVRAP